MKLTEKQKNCPYCHVGSRLTSLYNGSTWVDTELGFNRVVSDIVHVDEEDTYGDIWFDPVNKTLTSWGEGGVPLVVDINYCPICGRRLDNAN